MTARSIASVAVALCLASEVPGRSPRPPEADKPILLGDGAMVESATGPFRFRMIPARLASPSKAPAPPCRMPTVLRDGKKSWKLYGQGEAGLVHAVSTDGLSWQDASGALAVPNDARANLTPLLDDRAGVAADEKYKALGGSAEAGGLFALASSDGKVWRKLAARPVIVSSAREALYGRNSAVWSRARNAYVAFVSERRNDRRVISRSTSRDFRTWSPPTPLELNADGEDIWSATVFPVETNPPLLIGLLTRTAGGKTGPADICLATSRDGGKTFRRPLLEAWVRPEAGVTDWRSMVPSPLVAFVRPKAWTRSGEQAFHAGSARYEVFRDRVLACTARALEPALPADEPGDWDSAAITTKPFIVTGSSLELNVSTDSFGTIKAEILRADGKPLPGYRLADSRPDWYTWVYVDPVRRAAELRKSSTDIYGDRAGMVICWRYKHRDNPQKRSRVQWWPDWDIRELKGRTVRLRIVMNGADLFSFRTVDREARKGKPVLFSKDFPAGRMVDYVEAGE